MIPLLNGIVAAAKKLLYILSQKYTFENEIQTYRPVVSKFGNVVIKTTQSKYGVSSGYFDGAGDYLTTSNTPVLGSIDFTIEAWVYLNALPTSDAWPTNWTNHFVIVGVSTQGSSNGFALLLGQTKIICHNADTQYAAGLHGITTGGWYHIAVVRSGNTLTTYVNGVSKGSSAFTGAISVGNVCYIGCETSEGAWFNGYMDELRISSRAEYTSNFTPPVSSFPDTDATDPYFGCRLLILHFEGTDNSTNFIAERVNSVNFPTLASIAQPYTPVWTAYGNAKISTAYSKWGNGSICFDQSNGTYVNYTPIYGLTLGLLDFTIEGWYYHLAYASNSSVFYDTGTVGSSGSRGNSHVFFINSSGQLVLYSASAYRFTSTVTLPLNTWNHIALERINGVWTGYLNGVAIGTATFILNDALGGMMLGLGCDTTGLAGATYGLKGYINDFRVTYGRYRYGGNFTPPSAQFGDDTSTDPYFDYVDNLIHFQGPDNSTTLVSQPVNGKMLNPLNSATMFRDNKYSGVASARFLGPSAISCFTERGPYNRSYFNLPGPFTIKAKFFLTSTPGTHIFIARAGSDINDSGSNFEYALSIESPTRFRFYRGQRGTNQAFVDYTVPEVSLNVWHDIEFSRDLSNKMRLWIDGIETTTLAKYHDYGSGAATFVVDTVSFQNVNKPLQIGGWWNYAGYGAFPGYIDDLKIYKGAPLHTSNFTPD